MNSLLQAGPLGPLLAFFSSVTWAVGSSRYSQLSTSHSAFAINFARALFALPLFLIAAFLAAGGWAQGLASFQQVTPAHFGWFALSMIASYGLGDVLFLASSQHLGVPTALAIASCYPLWTAFAGRIFRSEALGLSQTFGLILAVIGVILVIYHSPKSARHGNLRKGIGLALLTSVMWALNSFSCAQGGQALSVPVSNAIRMIFALFFCAVFSRVLAPRSSLLLPFQVMRGAVWVFAFEAFGGSYFYVYGLTHSTLAVGATLSSLAPVLSVPVAWALGLEKVSIYRTVAILMVVIGISLLLGAANLV